MSAEWYYTGAGEEQTGPISASELKELAKTGVLKPDDLVWRLGMPDWRPAASIKGLLPPRPPGPPPVPASHKDSRNSNATQRQDRVKATSKKTTQKSSMLAAIVDSKLTEVRAEAEKKFAGSPTLAWAYRVALIVAIFSVFLPWATSNVNIDIDSRRGIGGFPAEYSFGMEPIAFQSNMSMSVNGISMLLGFPSLLIATAGCVLSFLAPAQLFSRYAAYVMAGFGAALLIATVVSFIYIISAARNNYNASDSFGNFGSASYSAGFGLYLLLICALAAVITGFLNPWSFQRSSLEPVSQSGSDAV